MGRAQYEVVGAASVSDDVDDAAGLEQAGSKSSEQKQRTVKEQRIFSGGLLLALLSAFALLWSKLVHMDEAILQMGSKLDDYRSQLVQMDWAMLHSGSKLNGLYCESTVQRERALDAMAEPVGLAMQSTAHAVFDECSAIDPNSYKNVKARFYFGTSFAIRGPIVDVGGNTGEDLVEYIKNFPHAQIYCFEPIHEHVKTLRGYSSVQTNSGRISIIEQGVGGRDEKNVVLRAGNDSTIAASEFQGPDVDLDGHTVKVSIVDIINVLRKVYEETGQAAEAMSLNCEGCEYGLLRRFVDSPWLGVVRVIQLSWHIPEIDERLSQRCYIEDKLRKAGYKRTYTAKFAWEGWELPCASSSLQNIRLKRDEMNTTIEELPYKLDPNER